MTSQSGPHTFHTHPVVLRRAELGYLAAFHAPFRIAGDSRPSTSTQMTRSYTSQLRQGLGSRGTSMYTLVRVNPRRFGAEVSPRQLPGRDDLTLPHRLGTDSLEFKLASGFSPHRSMPRNTMASRTSDPAMVRPRRLKSMSPTPKQNISTSLGVTTTMGKDTVSLRGL
jgi:hypothetical protein